MHLALLAHPQSWYVRDLRRAAAGRHEIAVLPFSELSARVTTEATTIRTGGVDLAGFDAVLVRTMPPGSLEQVVFRMNCLWELARHVRVVNSPRSLEYAIDKFHTLARLRAAGLHVPRTFVCQTVDDAMAAFEALGGRAVVKPLFGGEGRGITRLDDDQLALRAFKMLVPLGAVLYVQEFIDHPGHDLRLFTLGDRIFGMRRHNDRDWRTNVSRGARGEPMEVSDEHRKIAGIVREAIGAEIAGIDLLPGPNGELYAIEVNAVPGWQGLSRTLGLDIAALVLEHLERSM